MKKKSLVGWVSNEWKKEFKRCDLSIMRLPFVSWRKYSGKECDKKIKITIEEI